MLSHEELKNSLVQELQDCNRGIGHVLVTALLLMAVVPLVAALLLAAMLLAALKGVLVLENSLH